MQVAFALREPSVRFDEPVRTVLRQKSPVLWSISPDATVYEAIHLMSDRHVGCLLVLSGGRPLSVLTRTDILAYFEARAAVDVQAELARDVPRRTEDGDG